MNIFPLELTSHVPFLNLHLIYSNEKALPVEVDGWPYDSITSLP